MGAVTCSEAIDHANRILLISAEHVNRLDDRWQAIIQVSEFLDTHPEDVWAFVEHWGKSSDPDIRDAIATVLLEHLLEQFFDHYFSRVRTAIRDDSRFADTFLRSWPFGQSETGENAAKFQLLKSEAMARRDQLSASEE